MKRKHRDMKRIVRALVDASRSAHSAADACHEALMIVTGEKQYDGHCFDAAHNYHDLKPSKVVEQLFERLQIAEPRLEEAE